MIEAVNSVLQTAPFVRASSEQNSAVDSFAANPDRVQKVTQFATAPYVSPYIHLDVNYDKAVIQLRNGETGDVENQFPSQPQLEAQARAAVRRQAAQQEAASPRSQEDNAQIHAPQRGVSRETGPSSVAVSISPQQQAAFDAAARTGGGDTGNVALFA